MEEFELKKNSESLIKIIQKENLKVHGMKIFFDDREILNFGNCTERFPIYSITKSILSMAVGIAESEKGFDISSSVLKYLPLTYLENNLILKQQLEKFSTISIERLLTMSVKGFDFRPEGEDWLLYSLNSNIDPQKKEFHYTNICAYLVSVALSEFIGKDLYEYIQEKIFDPLEIAGTQHSFSPEGFFNGASGIMLSVDELSKIGKVFMNEGSFNGKRIVSGDYVKRACSLQINNRESGYGYFVWKFLDGFSLNGKWGQKCFCLPSNKIMITILSDLQEGSDKIKNEIKKWLVLDNRFIE